MNETLSLLAALVSAFAAVVGTGVSVAQWRASRPKPQVAPPPRAPAARQLPAPPPAPAAAQPAGRKLARAAAVAVGAGAATAVFSALTDLVYWLQESSEQEQGSLLVFLAGVTYLAALTAFLLGLFVLFAGLVKRRKRIAGLGALAVLLSLTLWFAIAIADAI